LRNPSREHRRYLRRHYSVCGTEAKNRRKRHDGKYTRGELSLFLHDSSHDAISQASLSVGSLQQTIELESFPRYGKLPRSSSQLDLFAQFT